MRTIALLFMGCALVSCQAPKPPATTTSSSVKGRVVDDSGAGLAEVSLLLMDTRHLSGHHDGRCGTYYLQQSVQTDADGRFTADLPFEPNKASVSGASKWLEYPSGLISVDASEELSITLPRIPHRTLTGLVVNAEGTPIAGAVIGPGASAYGPRTDERGRFELEIAAPPPENFRVRRMGYRPLMVDLEDLGRVVLAQRRPMVTVTVLETETQRPVGGLVNVSLWQQGERLSFCTAGDPAMTHEPAAGQCSLDAEPGQLELRLEGKPVSTLNVANDPVAVTVSFTTPPPPVLGPNDNGY